MAIDRVKENLARFEQAGMKTEYKVLLDCNTGEMRFAKTISKIQFASDHAHRAHSEWKEVRLIRARGRFEIEGLSGINKMAQKVMNETLSVLNGGTRIVGEASDLLGWMGTMNRFDAEKTLSKSIVGTYLIREADEIAKASAYHFGEENFTDVHPYIITVVGEEGKISDELILRTDRGWIYYNDDPLLRDYEFFSSPKDLLSSLSFLKRPIF